MRYSQTKAVKTASTLFIVMTSFSAFAGENLFNKVTGAETLPEGASELYQTISLRSGKGEGEYKAWDYETEYEYGYSNKLSISGSLKMMSLDTSGLIIDGYLPEERDFSLKTSGIETSMKYMFLSPALDDMGLSGTLKLEYDWIDPHSGQDKDTYSLATGLQVQNYMLEGELIWVGNLGIEATYAKRDEIAGLPADFDWPTDPEMEIELKTGTGISYRFAPNWFASLEVTYETEFETEVGQERWSIFAGPTIHYGSSDFWWSFSWTPQIEGGGEQYPGQTDTSLHLIEKTEDEFQLKVAFNF